ncbi:unnamed protein product [Dibothriocephalus latus]|uniref:Uncharacterized protein n=1 Tax=Dibothriocephalus latus TaxID=60516 RepID=A0A3P6QRQ3_DIBLA|nr:unnamed protein product [Dibothriocephalus latus]
MMLLMSEFCGIWRNYGLENVMLSSPLGLNVMRVTRTGSCLAFSSALVNRISRKMLLRRFRKSASRARIGTSTHVWIGCSPHFPALVIQGLEYPIDILLTFSYVLPLKRNDFIGQGGGVASYIQFSKEPSVRRISLRVLCVERHASKPERNI